MVNREGMPITREEMGYIDPATGRWLTLTRFLRKRKNEKARQHRSWLRRKARLYEQKQTEEGQQISPTDRGESDTLRADDTQPTAEEAEAEPSPVSHPG